MPDLRYRVLSTGAAPIILADCATLADAGAVADRHPESRVVDTHTLPKLTRFEDAPRVESSDLVTLIEAADIREWVRRQLIVGFTGPASALIDKLMRSGILDLAEIRKQMADEK